MSIAEWLALCGMAFCAFMFGRALRRLERE